MTRWLSALFLLLPVLSAQTVPGRYIVELQGAPLVGRLAPQGKQSAAAALRTAAADEPRRQLRAEQAAVQAALAERAVTVLDRVEAVANALIVEMPDARVAEVAALPGVARVYPVAVQKRRLEEAITLHRVREAWQTLGGSDRAGAGIKIGIIDSGIDVSHPAFRDANLPALPGYPKVGAQGDLTFTNSKVIVARSYVNLLDRRDPDQSARDRVGHGTAVAAAAAGLPASGPLGTALGVAPQAYLGSYKVFGSPGVSEFTNSAAVLEAIDDAVEDGMDVINLSLGSDLSARFDDDPEARALDQSVRAGVVVVVAVGNNGTGGANTIGSNATVPSVIAVGATTNSRRLASSAVVDGLGAYIAVNRSGIAADRAPVSGPLADVEPLDGNGLACGTLPAGSLEGRVALILRGVCTFEDKLNNAAAAGAAGALVYTNPGNTVTGMIPGSATLPAQMVSNEDGQAIKQFLATQAGAVVRLQFAVSAVPSNADLIAGFSARGPNIEGGIKPDLVAVGSSLYLPTQTFDEESDMYGANGFTVQNGTSFSAPLVAGAIAVLKAARPGLSPDQYRSLLVNSASPFPASFGGPARVQEVGAGLMDVAAAVRSALVAEPAIVNFGLGTAEVQRARTVRLTNVSSQPETYTLQLTPRDFLAVPTLSTTTVSLPPGGSTEVTLRLNAAALPSAEYEGAIRVRAAATGVESRIPYWYAVPSSVPYAITLLQTDDAAETDVTTVGAILFRVVDATGQPILGLRPEVTVLEGGGSVQRVESQDARFPGVYAVTLRYGSQPGLNRFLIRVEDVTREVGIVAE